MYDRHKTRAMWELISGLLRGSEEWPGRDRAAFWEWLTPLLPELFQNIRHDTTKCWDISIEYVLHQRDPRRFKPLVDFCLDLGLHADFLGGSAFDLARRLTVVRSVIRCLQWRFDPWADEFIDLYFKSISSPYAEVRAGIAQLLNAMDQLKFHPSYPSAAALTNDILGDPHLEKDIMRIRSGVFTPQLQDIMSSLSKLMTERPHGPKAVLSAHDTSAMSSERPPLPQADNAVLGWLGIELTDVHAVAAFPYIIPVL